MNAPIAPLSGELLAGAALSALGEHHVVSYSHILLNEKRWRAVVENEGISFSRGLPVKLIHPDDLFRMLEAALGSFGYNDTSAFLIPEAHYEQSLLKELDFRFDTTRQIEDVLRTEVTVKPCEGEHQYWYTAEVMKGRGHQLLEDLVSPEEYHGTWQLRDDVRIQVCDSEITIVAHKQQEIIPLLIGKYGVRVNTSGLRSRAGKLLEQAVKLEDRARYFEHLSKNQ